MSKKQAKIYVLTCESASNLGGPMGSESTQHIFSKLFKTLTAAKLYAKQYNIEWDHVTWQRYGRKWACDARTHLYSITLENLR